MDLLETGMKQSISENLRFRFIPYLQLHEFEGLLFCDYNVFFRNYKEEEFREIEKFKMIFTQFSNPEDINNRPGFTPSDRLKNHILGYNKVLDGPILAKELGLDSIREKCKRFDEWVRRLERI